MPKSKINGCFFFKASHAQELMEDKTVQSIQVEVVKVIQLTGQQFRDFSANLLRDTAPSFLIYTNHSNIAVYPFTYSANRQTVISSTIK